jgi:hypothetical protein
MHAKGLIKPVGWAFVACARLSSTVSFSYAVGFSAAIRAQGSLVLFVTSRELLPRGPWARYMWLSNHSVHDRWTMAEEPPRPGRGVVWRVSSPCACDRCNESMCFDGRRRREAVEHGLPPLLPFEGGSGGIDSEACGAPRHVNKSCGRCHGISVRSIWYWIVGHRMLVLYECGASTGSCMLQHWYSLYGWDYYTLWKQLPVKWLVDSFPRIVVESAGLTPCRSHSFLHCGFLLARCEVVGIYQPAGRTVGLRATNMH